MFGIHETGAAVFVLQVSLATLTPTLTPTPLVATATSTPSATPPATEPQVQTSTSEVTATSTPRVVTTPTAQPPATEHSGEEGANPSPTQITAIVAPLPTAQTRGETASEEIDESLSSTRTFAYSDWDSGWSQDDSSFYGRPWTVVYGAFSAHPRAILSFTLDGQPDGDAVLEVTGLDDEWQGSCVINVLVNGTSTYIGPSPWQSYSGNAADFSDAEWTTSALTIPAGFAALWKQFDCDREPGSCRELRFAALYPAQRHHAAFQHPILTIDVLLGWFGKLGLRAPRKQLFDGERNPEGLQLRLRAGTALPPALEARCSRSPVTPARRTRR